MRASKLLKNEIGIYKAITAVSLSIVFLSLSLGIHFRGMGKFGAGSSAPVQMLPVHPVEIPMVRMT